MVTGHLCITGGLIPIILLEIKMSPIVKEEDDAKMDELVPKVIRKIQQAIHKALTEGGFDGHWRMYLVQQSQCIETKGSEAN